MNQVRISLLKKFNTLLGLLLAILGFSVSCDPITQVEYGTPSADFKIIGKIESVATNNAIEGIQVTMKRKVETSDSTAQLIGVDSILSVANGTYELIEYGGFPDDKIYYINVHDIDGDLNGSYQEMDTTIEFIDPSYSGGDGNWDKGLASKELNIKLKPKE